MLLSIVSRWVSENITLALHRPRAEEEKSVSEKDSATSYTDSEIPPTLRSSQWMSAVWMWPPSLKSEFSVPGFKWVPQVKVFKYLRVSWSMRSMGGVAYSVMWQKLYSRGGSGAWRWSSQLTVSLLWQTEKNWRDHVLLWFHSNTFPTHNNHVSFRSEKVEIPGLQYDMQKGLANEKIPMQSLRGLISGPLLRRCQRLSLLCFHLSALGRKPEGNWFRMEETSETECSLSKLKISLRQSPPPSHCHFHFLAPSLLLCLPFVSSTV